MTEDQQFEQKEFSGAPGGGNGLEQVPEWMTPTPATSIPAAQPGLGTANTPPPAAAVSERVEVSFPDEEEEEPPAASDSLSRFITGTPSVEIEDDGAETSILPRQPRTLLDLGLSKAFLTDLVLKIMHYSGTPSMVQLTRRLGLGPTIVQHLVGALQEEHLIEVLSQSDLFTGNYRYRLSSRGQQRVVEALDRSRYAGPAPVTAEQYGEVIRRAQAQSQDLGRGRIKTVLNELVLSSETADSVARTLFSGKAAILYGPSGNGKTSILERFATDMVGFAVVPYAIYAFGQVIRVFDQSIHQSLESVTDENTMKEDKFDRRWVMVRRPAIVLGAEFGRETLDLAYDPLSRFYQAPPHIKAQGGLLVVDDFGRQKIESRELLTRWLIPLERGWDTLSLVSGEKVTVPFNIQILFGTNLRVKELADDALLRRILYKVEIPNPRPQEFTEILRKMCLDKRVLVVDGALEIVVDRLYNEPGLKPRAAFARDLVDILIESATFDGRDPILDHESFERVFKLFVAQETDEEQSAY